MSKKRRKQGRQKKQRTQQQANQVYRKHLREEASLFLDFFNARFKEGNFDGERFQENRSSYFSMTLGADSLIIYSEDLGCFILDETALSRVTKKAPSPLPNER